MNQKGGVSSETWVGVAMLIGYDYETALMMSAARDARMYVAPCVWPETI
jgi:hypothetical protein